ncbi:peptidoglycan recognition protein family protein [Streptosporangium sp. CA-115845]|uniref:peptidoglycan recognition protein family protein n=1 Tax=Streptosporangium sp. CA-115845 TaxID=3240071 RepID=UPI003D8BF401
MRMMQARHFHRGRIAPIRLLVVHDMEWPETVTAAEDCAKMFATMTRPASAHVNIDTDSIVRSVKDADTAFAAPGANADGLHAEFAGRARQTRAQWLDAYSRPMLELGAGVFATWSRLHKIPVRHLTRAQVKAGLKGITDHATISAVYKRSDHSDPGPHFPWDVFLPMIKERVGGGDGDDEIVVPTFTATLKRGNTGDPVRVWQRQMRARGWNIKVDGVFDAADASTARKFQIEKGLPATGTVDKATWRAAWIAPIT